MCARTHKSKMLPGRMFTLQTIGIYFHSELCLFWTKLSRVTEIQQSRSQYIHVFKKVFQGFKQLPTDYQHKFSKCNI